MEGDKGIGESRAGGQKRLAPADEPGILSLRQPDLIFDHVIHRPSGGQNVDGVEPVQAEQLRNALRISAQRIIIGADGVKDREPCGVVLPHQPGVTLLARVRQGNVPEKRQPQRQKVAAQGHALLQRPGAPGALQRNMGVGKAALQKQRLRTHDLLRPAAVAVRDAVIMRHALVHLGQLCLQRAGRPVEHHQHGGRAERPAAAPADGDGRTGHFAAGAAVQAAHGRNIVVG